MSLALAERYSSLSFQDCLRSHVKRESGRSNVVGDPLVDLPLRDSRQRTFAVPPGIEVRIPNKAHHPNSLLQIRLH